MRKTVLLIFLYFISNNIINAQRVSTYQAGAYQPGIMNIRDLATPEEPGLIFLDYNYWNNSNAYYDRSGNKVSDFDIDNDFVNTTIDLSIDLSGYTNVPVLFYISKLKILGGTYMASINPIFLSSNAKVNIHSSLPDESIESNVNIGGFGDMSFMPLGLGWSFNDEIDLSLFYTIYAPTGKYKTGATDNIGRGYWTHQFQLPTYFYFMEKATAFFIMPTFETNGKLKDAGFRAGNRFTIEYGISQYLNSWLEAEILNGHNWQTGNDSGGDFWWQDTPLDSKDRTSTVSFGVGVWPWEGKLNLRLKYAMDYGTKQRFKSDILSFSVIYIPNLLTEFTKK